jgi:hypothetical protein
MVSREGMALCPLKSLAFWENGWQGLLAMSLKTSTVPITYARRTAKLFPCRPAFADDEPPESNDGWRKWH